MKPVDIFLGWLSVLQVPSGAPTQLCRWQKSIGVQYLWTRKQTKQSRK